MNINKIETGFTNVINIGLYAIFIHMKKDGVYMSIDEIYQQCEHFNNVIVLGDEPLLQREEVSKLFKKLARNNPNIHLELHSFGMIKPSEINSFKENITFFIYVQLSSSDKMYHERINDNSLIFYLEFGANFLFKIEEKEDLDEVVKITKTFGIKKSQTFLISDNYDILYLIEKAKFYGFNIAPTVVW